MRFGCFIEFVIGSLIAALVGVTLNVYQARLKEDKGRERTRNLVASGSERKKEPRRAWVGGAPLPACKAAAWR